MTSDFGGFANEAATFDARSVRVVAHSSGVNDKHMILAHRSDLLVHL